MSNPVRDAKWKAAIGSRVSVEGKGEGKLAYYGTTKASKGEKKCGVALDEANGKHDGMVNGQRYFKCTSGHGVLTSPDNITILTDSPSKPKSKGKGTGKKTPKKKAADSAKASAAASSALEEERKAEAEIEEAMKKMAALEEAANAEAEIEAARAAMARLEAATAQPPPPANTSAPPPIEKQESAAELQLKAELEAMKQKLAAATATADAERAARERAEAAKLKEAEMEAMKIEQDRTRAPPASLPEASSDPALSNRLSEFERKLASVEAEKAKSDRESQAHLARVTAKVMQRILGGQAAVDQFEQKEELERSEADEARIKEQEARIASERRALEAEARANQALALVQQAEQTMKEVREGVQVNHMSNQSDEMQQLKEQLRLANVAKEEAETKARLAQEGKVVVDSVKMKWL